MPVAQRLGIPGGPESLSILVMILIPVLVIALIYRLIQAFSGSNDARLDELERLESEHKRD